MLCPGVVCVAPAARLGGRCLCWFLLLPLGSSLPSRPSRCVLRVVPPGCPFPSPAGTPFHSVCAFLGLAPLALLVRAVCPLRVCALLLPRRTPPFPPPPPGLVWRAPYARFRCRAPMGPFQAVPAPPRFLPRSPAPAIELLGGGPVPSSPCMALGRAPPRGRACASGEVGRLGGVGGGVRSGCRPPFGAWLGRGWWGGPGARGVALVGPSLCLP